MILLLVCGLDVLRDQPRALLDYFRARLPD